MSDLYIGQSKADLESGIARQLSSITTSAVTNTDSLIRFRDEFPILSTSTYLVSNSLGAMPRTVPEKLAEYATQWRTRGVRAWAEGWWELPVTMGSHIAPLLGAASGESST